MVGLIRAAQRGDAAKIRARLRDGCAVEELGADGSTALLEAARCVWVALGRLGGRGDAASPVFSHAWVVRCARIPSADTATMNAWLR